MTTKTLHYSYNFEASCILRYTELIPLPVETQKWNEFSIRLYVLKERQQLGFSLGSSSVKELLSLSC